MDEKKLYLLLDVINRNGSVTRLIREGMDFAEIAIQTNHAVSEELVSNSDDRIVLTEKGIETLKVLGDKYERTNKEKWIEKDKKSQVEKIDKNAIFVPSQNELTFLIRSLK